MWCTRPGKRLHNELERSTMLFMGKSTINYKWAIFYSYVTNYRRVAIIHQENSDIGLLHLCRLVLLSRVDHGLQGRARCARRKRRCPRGEDVGDVAVMSMRNTCSYGPSYTSYKMLEVLTNPHL